MRGLTNRCGDRERAANGLPEPYRQKSGDRTSQYCDMRRSTSAWVRGPHTGTTEGLILLAGCPSPNGFVRKVQIVATQNPYHAEEDRNPSS